MTLQADDQGRLPCPALFTPNGTFDAERQADGVIRVIEKEMDDVPVVEPVETPEGFLIIPVKVERSVILGAIRADRDAR